MRRWVVMKLKNDGMTLTQRIEAMVQLGDHLRRGEDEYLEAVMARTHYNNQWLTVDNQKQAIAAIANQFLTRDALTNWTQKYAIQEVEPKTVGLILAGNIPLVGFHDVLCVFISGHHSMIKLSEKDQHVLPYLLKILSDIDPATTAYFQVVMKLKNFDSIIATGSNNTARYFESYFGKYPNIIRKNRNAVAVLDGKESETELQALGEDVFRYFGLGCRNVSKLYVPIGYNFDPLLEALHEFKKIVLNTKYKNNFDYHYAIYIINRVEYLANGCIMLREDEAILSPIANLYYEYYDSKAAIEKMLIDRQEEIQLVVSHLDFDNLETIGFGEAQQPTLMDYADGVDTVGFLLGI